MRRKRSCVVRRQADRKVPYKVTRWRPSLPQGDGTPIVPEKEDTEVFFLREGAAHEDGPERPTDTRTQGRYQEVTKGRGMRNANN